MGICELEFWRFGVLAFVFKWRFFCRESFEMEFEIFA